MALIDRAAARANNPAKAETKSVTVPAWGGDILIRRVSVKEQEHYWSIIEDASKGVIAPTGKRGSLVYMACVNADGSDFWTENDAKWLGDEANVGAVDLLFDAIAEFSGFNAKAQAAAAKKP